MKLIMYLFGLTVLLAGPGCVIREHQGGAYDSSYDGRGYGYRYDRDRDGYYYRGDRYPYRRHYYRY